MKMITIACFSKPEEAHLLRMRLEAGGVPAYVQDENIVQLEWLYSNAVGGVRVQISEEDMKAAEEILGSPERVFSPSNGSECPQCKSRNTQRDDVPRKFAFLSILLAGFPIPFFSRKRRCSDCGHTWIAGSGPKKSAATS